ncbi:MAG: hypothetical protein WB564_06405 [Dehalococcoidia bacterium]
MPTTDPAVPVISISNNLGTMVLFLGIFFIIVGIIIAGVVYRESREWKKLVLPMFDRGSTETAPESPGEAGSSTPRMSAFGKEILSRLFTHIDVAGLLGGAAIVIVGILVVLIGIALRTP